MAPTVGRVVNFHNDQTIDTQPMAAIITYVWGETVVNLAVFTPNGHTTGATSVVYGQDVDIATKSGKTMWSWPKRIE